MASAAAGHAIDGGSDDTGFGFGWASSRGRRATMEDEIITGISLGAGTHLWAVLDGHAGRRAVEELSELLPSTMREAFATAGDPALLSPSDLTSAVEAVDERLLAAAESAGRWDDGATALLAFTAPGELQLAQLGDSQAVLCSAYGAEALCPQHRVGDPDEDARLRAAGARVEDDRICGANTAVAVTRSLGDLDVKRAHPRAVLSTPEVSSHSLSAADELLILGCDGLWDVIGPEEAWDAAKRAGRHRNGGWDLEAAARALVAAALEAKSGDNVSVLVVSLRKRRGTIAMKVDHRRPSSADPSSSTSQGAQPASQPASNPAPQQPKPSPPPQQQPKQPPPQQQPKQPPPQQPKKPPSPPPPPPQRAHREPPRAPRNVGASLQHSYQPKDVRIMLNPRGGLLMVQLLKPPPMRQAPTLAPPKRAPPALPARHPIRSSPTEPISLATAMPRPAAAVALARPPRMPPAPPRPR